MQEFSAQLLDWYRSYKRDLPWRGTKNPYKIWLSEIILQQTRVEQGWNYYLAFTEAYPTVQDLAEASEQEVLKLWQGLGYYSRARNLHFSAKYITENLNGVFPKNYAELLKLKGVGKYTAAAIASFAYGEAVPAIDGNVYRVLARVFCEYTTINTPKAEKKFAELAMRVLPPKFAADFNQAMMELGATVCKPKKPDCIACPVVANCQAYVKNSQTELPVKKAAIKVKKRYFHYFIIRQGQQTLLEKRTKKDIWRHLFQFPLLEKKQPSLEDLLGFLQQQFHVTKVILTKRNNRPIIHKLTHQHIYLSFWEVTCEEIIELPKCHVFVDEDSLSNYPVPISISPFL